MTLITQPRARPQRASHLGALKFLSVARSHAGRVRELNEDAYLNAPNQGIWAVADGMGGHDSGEVASAMIVDALGDVDQFTSAYAFRDAVCAALQRVNAALRERAEERNAGAIGATVAALIAHEGHYACVWAGDSRIYLQRNGEFRRITRDHSVVQQLVDAGTISMAEARRHHGAHVITRAVGASSALDLDCAYGSIQPGDRFLLCSDGLSNMVEDREIEALLVQPPLEAAAEKMLNKALARGAPDNVTLVLVGAEKRFAA